MGPMYRATVSVTQFMIPDEILWRIAVYWPDLGNHWHEASWRLHPVHDSRSASCLPDLIHSTYVLVMPGLLNEMAHRPHGLLEVTQGDMCHVRATVLPPKINLPILQEFLRAFCRRGWPMVRCPSVPRSNVPKRQARFVQMLSIRPTKTNNGVDSLPRKRRGGFACAMARSDVGSEVLRSLVKRNNQDSEEAETGILQVCPWCDRVE